MFPLTPPPCSTLSLRPVLKCTYLGDLPSPAVTLLCFVFLESPHPFWASSHLSVRLLPVFLLEQGAGILFCWVHCQPQGSVCGRLTVPVLWESCQEEDIREEGRREPSDWAVGRQGLALRVDQGESWVRQLAPQEQLAGVSPHPDGPAEGQTPGSSCLAQAPLVCPQEPGSHCPLLHTCSSCCIF